MLDIPIPPEGLTIVVGQGSILIAAPDAALAADAPPAPAPGTVNVPCPPKWALVGVYGAGGSASTGGNASSAGSAPGGGGGGSFFVKGAGSASGTTGASAPPAGTADVPHIVTAT